MHVIVLVVTMTSLSSSCEELVVNVLQLIGIVSDCLSTLDVVPATIVHRLFGALSLANQLLAGATFHLPSEFVDHAERRKLRPTREPFVNWKHLSNPYLNCTLAVTSIHREYTIRFFPSSGSVWVDDSMPRGGHL